MKTYLTFLLLLAALTVRAQAPVPPPPSDANREAEIRKRAVRTETNNPATPPNFPRTLPGGRTPATGPTVTPNVPPPNVPPGNPPAPGAVPVDPANPTAPVAAPDPAVAPENAPPEPILIGASVLNWPAATLDYVLTVYAKYVGRTVIRPANLNLAQSIVLENQTPLTRTEIVQLLDAVLAINGVSMIPMGDKFVKAVPSAQAGAAGMKISTNAASAIPEMGSYITHVAHLKYLRPSEVQPIILPFASMATAVAPIDTSGIVVLRDNAENVKRMLEMIQKVDIAYESEFESEVIPIKFARAEDIATALNSLSSGGGGGTTVGNTRSGARQSAASQRPGVAGNTGMGNLGGYPGGQPMSPGASPTGTPSSSANFQDRLRNIVQKASASGDLTLIGQTKIIADTRSNSLLVFATREDMKMIKGIVEKLDRVLPQVLIETIIMDVTLDDTWALGISGLQTTKQFTGDFAGAGGVNAKRFTDNLFSGSTSSNAFTDLIGTGLRYFGKLDDNFYLQLEAAATDSRVNVIQKPRIQTSHATPASIFIGRTVPYVSGSYYGGGYGGGPSSSYQQLRVGIGLNVTPYINHDGLVLMQIDETIDELAGSTPIVGVGDVPNTTSRTLAAEVAVQDKETIILGGFIRDSDTSSVGGIPILKDIPILGHLFKSSGHSKERSELIVLMRPTVLRTPEMASLQVEEEKKRLPGVLQAEEINRQNELKYQQQYEKSRTGRRAKEAKDARDAKEQKAPTYSDPIYSDPPPPASSKLSPDELRNFSTGSGNNQFPTQQ